VPLIRPATWRQGIEARLEYQFARLPHNRRPHNLKPRFLLFGLVAFACFAAVDPVAARLAKEAQEAQKAGQIVRAYLLYSAAASRDPSNPTYRNDRDALAAAAQLLTKANVESSEVSADIKAAETAPEQPAKESAFEAGSRKELEETEALQSLPQVRADPGVRDFDLRGDEKSLFPEVATAYGIRAVWDPELRPEGTIHFKIDQVDFRGAMEALTAATHTFVFPITEKAVFFARNTAAKRAQLEPIVLQTVDLPDAVDEKDLTQAANAVRGALSLRSVAVNGATRSVIIRDRVTRARIAKSLLEALLLPRAQVSIEVQLLTVTSDRSYHYGVALPTSFGLVDFGHIGGFQSILSTVGTAANFLAFGGGATLFGVGLTDATLFATYSKSRTRTLYDADVVVDNGQTAEMHVGDKYPIAQQLYTGIQQQGALYNPVGQVTLEDLGLVLKMVPHVDGDGDVALDVEAQYKSLGTLTINTVPSIDQREFKGSVVMREGQWAVLAGIDESTHSVTRNGIPGLAQIPWIEQILSENTRDDKTENTLIVIKPTVTRLPMSGFISPQYWIGPITGPAVLL